MIPLSANYNTWTEKNIELNVALLDLPAKAVEKAVNVIVKWIITKFKEIFNNFVTVITQMLEGIINSYALYLGSIINMMCGYKVYSVDSKSDTGSSKMAEREFGETMLAVEYALFGEIMVIVGLMIALKAMSMGIEELVEIAIVKTAEEVLLTTFLGIIAKEMFKDIGNILKYNTNASIVINKTLQYLHLSIAGVITIINIAETFLEFFTKGSRLRFMAGFTLALTGYMLDLATKTIGVHGTALMYADVAGLVISLFGVLIMVYYKNRDTEELVIENSVPLVSLLEWVIAIVGVLKAITDTASDYSSNWEG
ncbi:MAG: hypothetical protein GXO25_06590 [Euryarchaeota archaeon]|nr:hypothetical protein [Euryarchaeota archaeon]